MAWAGVSCTKSGGRSTARVNEMLPSTCLAQTAGAIPALLPPGSSIDGEGPRMDGVPALGEHTNAILGELGLSAEQIATLRATKAI